MTTTNKATYKIKNANGKTGRAWDRQYAAADDAAEAIRNAYGWDEVACSSWYTDRDRYLGVERACSVYESEAERDRDADGAGAPRIVEVKADASR